MTEAEWLASDDLMRMLVAHPDTFSRRKLRLLACACCRLVWDRMPDARSRHAVEVAERFADGRALEAERRGAFEGARQVVPPMTVDLALLAALAAADDSYLSLAQLTAGLAGLAAERLQRALGKRCYAELAGLLREIAGNPYRPAHVDPALLQWDHGFVARFAASIYEERDYSQLPILADALEDAGCGDGEVLAHLRGPGPHVAGCWVLDLLLGKE